MIPELAAEQFYLQFRFARHESGAEKYIAALLAEREASGQHIGFEHVYGHAGVKVNVGADELANVGAMRPKRSELDWDMPRVNAERRMEEQLLSEQVRTW